MSLVISVEMILSNHVTKFDKLSCKGADTAKDFEWTTLDLQTARWTDGKMTFHFPKRRRSQKLKCPFYLFVLGGDRGCGPGSGSGRSVGTGS